MTWTIGVLGWLLVFLLLADRWRLSCASRDATHEVALLKERVAAEKALRESFQQQNEYHRTRLERLIDAQLIADGKTKTLVMQDVPPTPVDRRGTADWMKLPDTIKTVPG